MTIGCYTWMICLILIWFFYGRSRMFQLPQFVWALRSLVWDVFINFLLIDATDKRKISSDQKHLFIAFSLYPLSFFANTPFKLMVWLNRSKTGLTVCQWTNTNFYLKDSRFYVNFTNYLKPIKMYQYLNKNIKS